LFAQNRQRDSAARSLLVKLCGGNFFSFFALESVTDRPISKQ
jgi:hypothetical protein